MGACATKPRELKEEGEAPLPQEEKTEVSAPMVEGEGGENKQTTLGHLFKESEKKTESSQKDEDATAEEATATPPGETKGEEEKLTDPNEETSVPSLVKEMAPDSNNPTAEQKAAAVEEAKDSTLEKTRDSKLPLSTTKAA